MSGWFNLFKGPIPLTPNPMIFHIKPHSWLMSWQTFSIVVLLFSIISLIIFYFKVEPSPKANRNFWLIVVIYLFVSVALGTCWMYPKAKLLATEGFNGSAMFIATLFSAAVNAIFYLVVTYSAFMILAYFILKRSKLSLRAMRRYPFPLPFEKK